MASAICREPRAPRSLSRCADQCHFQQRIFPELSGFPSLRGTGHFLCLRAARTSSHSWRVTEPGQSCPLRLGWEARLRGLITWASRSQDSTRAGKMSQHGECQHFPASGGPRWPRATLRPPQDQEGRPQVEAPPKCPRPGESGRSRSHPTTAHTEKGRGTGTVNILKRNKNVSSRQEQMGTIRGCWDFGGGALRHSHCACRAPP